MRYSWLDIKMLARSLFHDPLKAPAERKIQVDGIHMFIRRRTSDLFVTREVFQKHVYGKPPHGFVLDLGANVGAFSLYAGRTATRVFAFEPDSSNFEQLAKNMALNRTLPISIFKKAVGGKNGDAVLYQAAVNKGSSSLVHELSTHTEMVEIMTLENALSLCGLSHVDFLKIDIEGSEYDLFETASIHTLRRISSIAMEMHRVRGKRYRDVITKLKNAGFKVRSSYSWFWLFGMKMVYAHRDA